MSTKSTLACWRDKNLHFHLYSEAGCDGTVYLDLHVGDERNYRGQAIDIPIVVWEAIRTKTIWRNDLVGKTDAQLRKIVNAYIDKRERDFQSCVRKVMKGTEKGRKRPWQRVTREQAEKHCGMIRFFGCMGYGSGDQPRAKQFKQGLASEKRERARQEEGQKQIDAIIKANASCPGVHVFKLKKRKK
jgi:hypothetical protein